MSQVPATSSKAMPAGESASLNAFCSQPEVITSATSAASSDPPITKPKYRGPDEAMSPGVAVSTSSLDHVVERRRPVGQRSERRSDVGATRDRGDPRVGEALAVRGDDLRRAPECGSDLVHGTRSYDRTRFVRRSRVQAGTARVAWCARILRLTRCRALSIVLQSQSRISAIDSYEFPSR